MTAFKIANLIPCRYFLVHQCWQFISVERPTFSAILSDLQDMAEKPHKHLILKVSKTENGRGYLSETGQVFLHSVAAFSRPQGKSRRRHSGHQTSTYSSMDDTTFTRDTDVTTVFAPSETTDIYDSYEDYLKGEFEELEKATQQWVDSDTASVPKKIAYFSGNLPNGVKLNAHDQETKETDTAASVKVDQPAAEATVHSDGTADQSQSPKQSPDSSNSQLAML